MFSSLSVVIELDKCKVSENIKVKTGGKKRFSLQSLFWLKEYEEETVLLSKHREPFLILIMVSEH